MSESNIAKELERDRRTINREVERGLVEHLNSDLTTLVAYNADRAQDVHDLVVGGKGTGRAALLTLVERKSRKRIIRKIKDKTQAAVNRAINGIERSVGKEAFKVTFKSR